MRVGSEGELPRVRIPGPIEFQPTGSTDPMP